VKAWRKGTEEMEGGERGTDSMSRYLRAGRTKVRGEDMGEENECKGEDKSKGGIMGRGDSNLKPVKRRREDKESN
jgi:hypothetical protein